MSLLSLAVTGRGLVDPAEPVIRADDEAFLRGRAAFETLRVYDGRPYRLAQHLERLAQSAHAIGLAPPDSGALGELAALAVTAAGRDEHVLRLFWTPSGMGLALTSEIPARSTELREKGVRAVSLLWQRGEAPWLLGGVKSTSYAANLAAEREAERRGADDAIFVDANGIVLEGPVTNIWWRSGATLFTPSLDLGILAGVTRRAVIELAAAAALDVREGAFELGDLAGADEAFTSSSVRELAPIVELDGAPIPRGDAPERLLALIHADARTGP